MIRGAHHLTPVAWRRPSSVELNEIRTSIPRISVHRAATRR